MSSSRREDASASDELTLRFEKRPQYLYAFITGQQDSLEASRKVWAKISAECQALGYKKVLVEEEVETNVELVEMYDLCAELVDLGFHGVQIAFVDRVAEQSADNLFAEDVAVNRGLWGRVFSSVAEAEAWLQGE